MIDVDLFAGPGGWDVGARSIGLEPLGIELDPDACATRRAAGLKTLEADVSVLDPTLFEPVGGLIASPPCQGFSRAGLGAGRKALPIYLWALDRLADGLESHVIRDTLDRHCDDERAHLVIEPLRWALDLEPAWIACEQVPSVLPIWERMAAILADRGYSAWAGLLSAEEYGVPQTRKRAFLLASRAKRVQRPTPTHGRYRRGVPRGGELTVQPWVSMADALGWADGSVGFPRLADTPSNRTSDRVKIDGVQYRGRDLRDVSEPAFALTEKSRSWLRLRANTRRAHAAERFVDEPAPTITGGHDYGDRVWVSDEGTVRVSLRDALVLQTFPADYPVRGSRSSQFRQVGNAVPPLLAARLLEVAS